MGILDRLVNRLGNLTQPSESTSAAHHAETQWVMPKFQGRDICDWVDVVAQLKREGNLESALSIAQGCMDAMVSASMINSNNVMEFYVSQVAIIQRKMRNYPGEIATIGGWLHLGIPPTREDHRLDLLKRFAKAQELQAKVDGRDPTPYTTEWKRLVDAGKATRPPSAGPSTGRSAASGVPYTSRSSGPRWVAPREALTSPSFVAVDFETANRANESACQIAMVRVKQGRVTDKYSTLLSPPRGFNTFEFTYLHGISARDVRRAPSWNHVATNVAQFSSDVPVFAHNATFDSGVWTGLDQYFGTQTLPQDFYCSYRTARRLVPGLENYKLPTVAAHLVPGYSLNHHRADSDAEACALIVAALQNMS